MTRELNVRITLSEPEADVWTDYDYQNIITDAIVSAIDPYLECDVEVQVETVKPKSEKK